MFRKVGGAPEFAVVTYARYVSLERERLADGQRDGNAPGVAKRRLGQMKGKIWIADDFDETPVWLIDAFDGGGPDVS